MWHVVGMGVCCGTRWWQKVSTFQGIGLFGITDQVALSTQDMFQTSWKWLCHHLSPATPYHPYPNDIWSLSVSPYMAQTRQYSSSANSWGRICQRCQEARHVGPHVCGPDLCVMHLLDIHSLFSLFCVPIIMTSRTSKAWLWGEKRSITDYVMWLCSTRLWSLLWCCGSF